MSEYGDVAAIFSSKASARILQQHRSSVGSVDNDSEARTLSDRDEMNDVHSVHSAPISSSRPVVTHSKSMTTSLTLEEAKKHLAELENAPGPSKKEIDEILAQYSDDSSESDESIDSSLEDEPQTVIMKVIVVGNARCGKTSTIRRFIQDEFSEEYVSTIGADFREKMIKYDNQLTISLQLWDIAGQDRFAKFTRGYFREAKGAVIVCDITRTNTVDAVVNWKKEIDTCCKDIKDSEEIPVVLLANKSDLLIDPMGALELGVNMQKCADKNNIVEWFRASAKSGDRINDAFECLIERMVKNYRSEMEKQQEKYESDTIKEEKVSNPTVIRLAPKPRQYRAVKQDHIACKCN